MKNTYFKISGYTLLLMLIIVFHKVLIQNNFFDNDYSIGYWASMTILKIALFLITLFFLKYEKINLLNFSKSKYILIIVGLLIFLRLYQNIISISESLKMGIDFYKLAIYSLSNLFVGLFEEFYFRLFVFTLLCSFYKKNLFKISILTSSLFAIVHMSNLILNSYSASDVLFQVMFAFASGLFFQILFINFKNIYIPSLIHFYIDFNSNLSEKFFNVSHNEIDEAGFDYTTFGIIAAFIIITLIGAYYNLRKKNTNDFQKPENLLIEFRKTI